MTEHAQEPSPEEVAELGTDHLEHGEAIDEGPTAVSFGAEPATTATALGRAILDYAKHYLDIPLREDAGVNADSHGYIRMFFTEGVLWKPEWWDNYIERFPKSPVAKPEWCAAFASYCVRKAHADANQPLPLKLNACTSGLRDNFRALGRFLEHDALYDADGAIRKDAKVLPRPGDIVLFQKHTALLNQVYDDGSFTTIEGNTYVGSPRKDGVYQCNHRADSVVQSGDNKGKFSLTGFCLLTATDAQVTAPSTSQTATTSQGAAGAQATAPPASQAATDTQGAADAGTAKDDDEPAPLDVKKLQQQLNAWIGSRHDTGLAALTADGIWGRKTEAAVTAFQKLEMHMDAPTGAADEATLQALDEKLTAGPPASPGWGQGEKGSKVAKLQQQLNAWISSRHDTGLTALTADGAFGAKTGAALSAFQKLEMNLNPPTGLADDATLRALDALVAAGKASS